jgi:hypothetical protein
MNVARREGKMEEVENGRMIIRLETKRRKGGRRRKARTMNRLEGGEGKRQGRCK